jgi:hypothetical protein
MDERNHSDHEPYEADTVRPVGPTVTRDGTAGRGRPIGLSLPGAIAGVLLVSALAFGAGGMLPTGDSKPDATPKAGAGEPATPKPAPDGGIKAGGDMAEPTDKADPTPKTEATPKPNLTDPPLEIERIELTAKAGDDKVVLEWSACDPDGFAAWKVVRSTNEGVSWPKGEGDSLVAAIGEQGTRRAVDTDAPKGKKLWYRVFGLVEHDGGLAVACKSTIDTAFIEKPAPEPTVKPDAEPGTLSLSLALKADHPYLDWSACSSDRFDLYKVLRSKDSTVTWPAGDNDAIVAAIGDREQTAFKDVDAPGGRKLWYRVFCLDKTADGYKILAASGAKAITTPTIEPPPDPVTLSFEATAGEGGVLLDWESCGSDGFVYYKVVRSQSANPSYLPWTDGTQLIAVIENAGNSAFEDGDVASGQTWFYRVQAIGRWNDQKVVLGQTRVIEVTVP